MSRVIKFRAWDKINSKMLENMVLGDRRWPNRATEWFNVMQYTGLKDKNGVEIYEGDELAIPFYNYYVPVVWHNSGWAVELGEYIEGRGTRFSSLDSFAEQGKVAGNTYETRSKL